jgi:hypothetical protein
VKKFGSEFDRHVTVLLDMAENAAADSRPRLND